MLLLSNNINSQPEKRVRQGLGMSLRTLFYSFHKISQSNEVTETIQRDIPIIAPDINGISHIIQTTMLNL